MKHASNEAPELDIRRLAVADDEPEPIWAAVPAENVFPCDSGRGLTRGVADRVIAHFSRLAYWTSFLYG